MTTGLPRGSADAAPSPPTYLPGVRARTATSTEVHGISLLLLEFVLSRPPDSAPIARGVTELAPRPGPEGDPRAFVVDAPGGRLAACATGQVQPVLSAPSCPCEPAERMHVVAKRPDHRRSGQARAVLTGLLDALAGQGVTLFDLHATHETRPLYAELGFRGMRQLMPMMRPDTESAPARPARPESGWLRIALEEYAATDGLRVLPLPERDFARLHPITHARRAGAAACFDTWGWAS
ncbi:GNAT family N-acetyltransferase [Streptomyces sp. NPDC057682]|uniref:GNAT family N-acetyltransferase n=1 Tax=Streptomyces sp. NPDC057682 TaxID=3346210 RepID=UPI0036843551